MKGFRVDALVARANERLINEAIKGGLREVERICVCPYCGDLAGEKYGCCGESAAHFEERWRFTDDGEDAGTEAVVAWNKFLDTLPDCYIENSA